MSIEVLKPGPLSALQDSARAGLQRFGVITSGVMDEWSHRIANRLVGNPGDPATLEITLMGPSLLFHEPALIAIAGADLSPRVGEQAVPMERPVLLAAGSRLDFGRRAFGCRAYLAVHGGFDVPLVMGSRSTYLRAGFGGFEGRALRKGDRLTVGAGEPAAVIAALAQARIEVPPHPGRVDRAIRVIAGQQWARFTDEAQALFLGSVFRVNLNSDRMGYRLEGPGLGLRAPLEMISEAVAFGSVQVPPDGQPIVLMADRQTTGGYPKIASVVSVDLPLLAQMVPGQELRFDRIDLDEAQRLYLARERDIGRLSALIDSLKGQR